MKISKKSILLLISSALLMALAIDLMIIGQVGGDAMTTLEDGLTKAFSFDVSIINWWLNFLFIVLAFLFIKEKAGIGTVLYPLLCSYFMSLLFKVLPNTNTVLLSYVYFIIGLFSMCMAIGLSVYCDIGGNGLVLVCLAAEQRLHISYTYARIGIDAIMLIIGIFLGGGYGLGTIASVLFIGKISDVFIKKLEFLK